MSIKEHDAIFRFLEVALVFRQLPMVTLGLTSEELIEIKISEDQMYVLTKIGKHLNTVSSIAKEIGFTKSRVSRNINILVRNKYVARHTYSFEGDNRRVRLDITKKGSIFLENLYQERHDYYQSLLEQFESEKMEILTTYLGEINSLILKIINPPNENSKGE